MQSYHPCCNTSFVLRALHTTSKLWYVTKWGSFMTAAECETYLERWLSEYVTGTGGLDWEMQARYPFARCQC